MCIYQDSDLVLEEEAAMIGIPGFMSPELILKKYNLLSIKSDLYSIALVLFAM